MRLRLIRLCALAAVACAWQRTAAAASELLPVGTSTSATATTCFELPIVILSPTSHPFPTKDCKNAPAPSDNCLKAKTPTNIEIIDNADQQQQQQQFNCVGNATTSVHPSIAHFRGQSSLGFHKHQYSIALAQAASFLGFPSDKTFVLNGPVIDGSLIRNHLAHWLYRSTGRYSPRTRHVVMFMRNTTTNELEYFGIYLALEKISYGPNRVALAPLDNKCNKTQLNGGWAWQLNPLNYGVYSPNVIFDQYELMFGAGARPVLMYPQKHKLTQTMRDYFVDPATGPLPLLYRFLYDHADKPDELNKLVDLGSFVDYMLHSELSQNTDAYRRSTYFFKDRDQPINAGPVWDFNLAFGTGANQQAWLHRHHLLWERLLTNYQFVGLTIKRWKTLRASVWHDTSIDQFIDSSVAPLEKQLSRCGAAWHGEAIPCANVNLSGTYKSHVDRVKLAIHTRAKWMDDNVVKLYAKIEPAGWAQSAHGLPMYNCAADGNDDGCLTSPDTYSDAVEMPRVRENFAGDNECMSTPQEEPSIDPCWLSVGIGSMTFCSGSGSCPPGPGAKCTCTNGRAAPTCAANSGPPPPSSPPPVLETVATAATPVSAKVGGGASARGHLGLLEVGGVVVLVLVLLGLVVVVQRRRRSSLGSEDERSPIMTSAVELAEAKDKKNKTAAYGTGV